MDTFPWSVSCPLICHSELLYYLAGEQNSSYLFNKDAQYEEPKITHSGSHSGGIHQ